MIHPIATHATALLIKDQQTELAAAIAKGHSREEISLMASRHNARLLEFLENIDRVVERHIVESASHAQLMIQGLLIAALGKADTEFSLDVCDGASVITGKAAQRAAGLQPTNGWMDARNRKAMFLLETALAPENKRDM